MQQSGGAPTNRITSVNNSGINTNYSYDSAGNVTNDGVHTYEYDAENRLKSVDGGTAAAYAYDHANRRIKKLVSGVSTNYLWEGSQLIGEHDGTTGATLANYVYAGAQMVSRLASGVVRYYLSDRLSVRLMLDNNGALVGRQGHHPFGQELATSGEQEKRRFTSYERGPEVGLDYAVNRYYSPGTGRFKSPDQDRKSASTQYPQSWNRYSYAHNDPTNNIDAFGSSTCAPWVTLEIYREGARITAVFLLNIFWKCEASRDGGLGGGGKGGGAATLPIGPNIPGTIARKQLSDFLEKFPECADKLETFTRSFTGFDPNRIADMADIRSWQSYGSFATFMSEGLVESGDPVALLQIRIIMGPTPGGMAPLRF